MYILIGALLGVFVFELVGIYISTGFKNIRGTIMSPGRRRFFLRAIFGSLIAGSFIGGMIGALMQGFVSLF